MKKHFFTPHYLLPSLLESSILVAQQCLDLLRVLRKEPEVVETYFNEVAKASGTHDTFDQAVSDLRVQLEDAGTLERRSRIVLGKMAIVLQAALLIRHSTREIAEAFCASRLSGSASHLYGTLPEWVDCAAIVDRSFQPE